MDTPAMSSGAQGNPEATICRWHSWPRSNRNGVFVCDPCDEVVRWPLFREAGE